MILMKQIKGKYRKKSMTVKVGAWKTSFDKLLTKLAKKKRQETQIIKIRNEKEDITIDRKKKIGQQYEHPPVNKLD